MSSRFLVFTAGLVCAAGVARAGFVYTAETKVDAKARGEQAGSMTVTGMVDGDKARIEIKQSGNPLMGAGSYMLTKDGGTTVYLVNPEKKTYMLWDIEKLFGAAGGAMQMMKGMMQMQISDPKVEKLTDEDGPKIQGYPTRHYRFRTTYAMEMTVMGMKNSTSSLIEEEVWSSTKLADKGFNVWTSKQTLKTGDEQVDALIKAQMDKAQGFPLRRVMVNTTTDGKGRETVSTTITEVTALESKSVSADKFELPADYKEEKMDAPAESAGGQEGAGQAPALPAFLKGFAPKPRK